MLEYRKATVDDAEELTAVRLEFLRDLEESRGRQREDLPELLRHYFLEAIPSGEFVAWLCLDESKIIGTSGLTFPRIPPGYWNPFGCVGYIMNIYTKKEYRGRGIGRALLEKIIAEGRARGLREFRLHATEEGRRLYSAFGFVESNREMLLVCSD